MLSLPHAVAEVFAAQGVLAREGLVPREGQTEMALAVAQTLEEGGALVVEAGTGVGKTFAYLVPLLLSGQRALISTATKNLQDQLFARDLPRLLQMLGLPLRLALLKGRSSYLCLHRLALARQDSIDGATTRALARIERWAQVTRSGDLAELPGLDERSPLMPRITSTRENCLGSTCPRAADCHVNLARREAMAADVVVINHHLFFADLAVRQSGVAEMLPSVDAIIFDEAHQLNETGVQFLGQQFSSAQWLDFARDVLACGQAQARGLADWHGLVHTLELSLQHTRSLVPPGVSRWMDDAPDGVHSGDWIDALQAMRDALHTLRASLRLLAETSPDLARLAERAELISERLLRFLQPVDPSCVRWVDVGHSMRWVHSPLDIAAAMTPLVGVDAQDIDAPDQGRSKSWIFTSATLGDDAALSWFINTCGLQGARSLQVPSPFDYPTQAAVWVPPDLPKPAQIQHSAALARVVRGLANTLGGRTLVLTTTLKAMREIAQVLRDMPTTWEVLVQGEQPKRELLARFTEAQAQGAVLVASASFWEGVDVPGEALQCVVIDKLPFPPPGDPLVDARARHIEAQGGQPFMDYWVPQAAVALKQGAGRLIRSEADRGLLVIGDTRLLSMGYGRRLMKALPPMRRLTTQEDALAWLAQIN
jgi:ATP-dependent DNA helicase DinG